MSARSTSTKEPHNWLLHHGNYAGLAVLAAQGINADNVKNLKVAFTVALGGLRERRRATSSATSRARPIVEDGMMYVTDGWGSVYAIDVSNGKKGGDPLEVRSRHRPRLGRRRGLLRRQQPRRRAVEGQGHLDLARRPAVLASTRPPARWCGSARSPIPAIAETLTLAPLVVRDIAIVGVAGGEFGIRGWIDGTDLNTGKQVWRTYTIPAPGEPGDETWKDGKERYKHGGGSVWETATYDPETDTFYQGIGNAGPDWDPEYRPGDNKWAASVLALSPSDGKIKWGYQYTPNDPYDFDEISEHPIIDAKVNGEDRKLVVHAARNGFYYALDRINGSFVLGKQYVDQLNWTTGLDPKTGMPLNYDPNTDVQEYAPGSHGSRAKPKSERLCPSHFGGKNWEPAAYNPELQLLYIPSIEGCNSSRDGGAEGLRQPGRHGEAARAVRRRRPEGHRSASTAASRRVDPDDRRDQGPARAHYPNYSGALATAGNLVFIGHADGYVDGT